MFSCLTMFNIQNILGGSLPRKKKRDQFVKINHKAYRWKNYVRVLIMKTQT